MAVWKIPQSQLANGRLIFLSLTGPLSQTLTTTDETIAQFVLPCDARVVKLDYTCVLTVDLTNVEMLVDGTAISSAYTIANDTTNPVSGTIMPSKDFAEYAAGTVIEVEADASESTAMSDFTATLVIAPVIGV